MPYRNIHGARMSQDQHTPLEVSEIYVSPQNLQSEKKSMVSSPKGL